ncbi:MAG: hypothetical protein EZS28_018127 [Streblomastix strix]|uniref:Uncharacterized protein n=1 Tax=Streblomastix strix TaxID=222440 RepID=A0A5J4VUQ4_9EUKA|nr:MAG: hypothetical protein EZS28_018127 [Streblomastix strix]
MNRFLIKAAYLQQARTFEEKLLSNAVVPFINDGQHHYSIKEIKPESQMSALFDKEIIISLSDTDHDITQIQNSFLSIVLTANIQLDEKFDQIDESYKDGLVLFVGLKSGSNLILEYTIYHRGKAIDGSLQNDATTESFIYNTIKPKSEKNNRKHIHSLYENIHKFETSACGTYISTRMIEDLIGNQTYVPYTIPIRFIVNIPLDDLLIFSAFTDYRNGLFGDLKIKFKINPHAFVFCQVNPFISLDKQYTINKDELLGSCQQKLMDIDLKFRNWSQTFQYPKQFTQLGCTVDLITELHAEQLTESGLKSLVCDIKPVTMSIKIISLPKQRLEWQIIKLLMYALIESDNSTANVHLLFLHSEQKYGHLQRLLHQLEYEHLKIFLCLTQPTFVFYFRKMQELRLASKILAIKTCKQPPADAISQICL